LLACSSMLFHHFNAARTYSECSLSFALSLSPWLLSEPIVADIKLRSNGFF
jgi:hypothetical protein